MHASKIGHTFALKKQKMARLTFELKRWLLNHLGLFLNKRVSHFAAAALCEEDIVKLSFTVHFFTIPQCVSVAAEMWTE